MHNPQQQPPPQQQPLRPQLQLQPWRRAAHTTKPGMLISEVARDHTNTSNTAEKTTCEISKAPSDEKQGASHQEFAVSASLEE